jgi:hypothetical protein
MMFFYPDLVDLSALGDGPLAPDMKPPDGIGEGFAAASRREKRVYRAGTRIKGVS